MKSKHHIWRKSSLALASGALLCAWSLSANALSLGQLNVQSALGEPLRAEIDILDINVDESSSLKTSIAPPERFATSGLEYNSLVNSLSITLKQRPNGRSYLSLTSSRAINEPYLDLILEANWATGRIMRDYTMLFDPPALNLASLSKPITPAQVSVPVAQSAPPAPQPAAIETPERAPATPTSAAPKPAANVAAPVEKKPSDVKQVTVKTGDTAAQIAMAHKPAQVTLDQMLAALLASNPSAFVDQNVNRLRSGAVLDLPTEAQALATPADQAQQTILAQGKDFNAFRAQLAAHTPAQPSQVSPRQASGTVSAEVVDKKPSASPDKLTLSKGSMQTPKAEDQIAKDLAKKDTAQQSQSVNKNIEDLEKLSKAASTNDTAAPAPTAEPAPATSAAPSIEKPATVASNLPAAADPSAEVDLIDALLDDPTTPVAAGLLMVLLAGLGFYKIGRRRKVGTENSFLSSQLQPDSFFDASGGKRVDTNDSSLNGSSMVYSPSQLDAADDVDPIAEADVYLAYGRDLQAEEILKEALNTQSNRIAIHVKLCEIYAKRRDIKGLDGIAQIASTLTQQTGPEWAHICELGRSVDTTNSLYRAGVAQQSLSTHGRSSPPLSASSSSNAQSVNMATTASSTTANIDLDLDLDFAVDAPTPSSTTSQTASANTEATHPALASPSSSMMEFDMGALSLDLNAPADQPLMSPEDPLATKLALAEEFRAIGNVEGARELIHEILAQASGDLKSRAQTALSRLG